MLELHKHHENLKASVRWILNFLKKHGYRWNNIEYLNNNRYLLVHGEKGRQNILITYKREPFFNFYKMGFKDEQGREELGVGDTINCQHLIYARKNKVKTILAIFPNNAIYHIKLFDFLCKAHKWINKEGKKVMSISIHHYTRLFDIKGVF